MSRSKKNTKKTFFYSFKKWGASFKKGGISNGNMFVMPVKSGVLEGLVEVGFLVNPSISSTFELQSKRKWLI